MLAGFEEALFRDLLFFYVRKYGRNLELMPEIFQLIRFEPIGVMLEVSLNL